MLVNQLGAPPSPYIPHWYFNTGVRSLTQSHVQCRLFCLVEFTIYRSFLISTFLSSHSYVVRTLWQRMSHHLWCVELSVFLPVQMWHFPARNVVSRAWFLSPSCLGGAQDHSVGSFEARFQSLWVLSLNHLMSQAGTHRGRGSISAHCRLGEPELGIGLLIDRLYCL